MWSKRDLNARSWCQIWDNFFSTFLPNYFQIILCDRESGEKKYLCWISNVLLWPIITTPKDSVRLKADSIEPIRLLTKKLFKSKRTIFRIYFEVKLFHILSILMMQFWTKKWKIERKFYLEKICSKAVRHTRFNMTANDSWMRILNIRPFFI